MSPLLDVYGQLDEPCCWEPDIVVGVFVAAPQLGQLTASWGTMVLQFGQLDIQNSPS
jgi:hypothetical protein